MIHTYTDDDVGDAVGWRDVLRDLPQAFESLRTGDASIQARQRIDCGNWKLSGMGALWESRAAAAYKTYTSLNGQFNFLVNLFDLNDQSHHVMPAAEITRARTAAMTAWVAPKIAVPGAKKMALFGLGIQGRTHLEALQETMGFSEIAVVDTADVSQACDAFSKRYKTQVHQVTPQEAVTGADLIVTVTRSKQALFDGAWLKRGASICAVGTSLPTGTEIDQVSRARSDRVIVEWKPQSLVEAGEIVIGLGDKSLDASQIRDLPELLANDEPWRRSPEEIILFKAVGVGLSDLVAARLVVNRLRGRVVVQASTSSQY
ncbi:ornithine cyclodeaminase [Polaromonas sp. YR568]|uniref:ornithine cyclodeaminase family protein n=1 Tax=Polaromonas sp. YR568 TaxID=1855301 RepID=UPI0008F2CB9D|nr:ornithine cyclodeaminase family protein [Polaromonas sp. YR568]SFU80470.1 ornithine cyclodeaminase [Polaromonas sp. YR568]